MKIGILLLVLLAFFGLFEAAGQWGSNGSNIYNTNSGNVGIGNNAPTTLFHVAKMMTEPTITIQNLGGAGGATYTMMDQVSGANWKFKATNSGGFKIRDHANLLDVIVIEPNSSANAIYVKTGGHVGIGTASPETSAALEISSTERGLLIPRLSQQQIWSLQNPANGLQVYCTTDGKLYIYVSAASQWKEVAYGAGTLTPGTCGYTITKSHVAGDVAPVNKTTTYGTVNGVPGEPGKCWITSNLGSDQQATAVDDASEASAGWYWQFNRKQGYKHDGTTLTPAWTITSISENSDWLAANDPCTIELGTYWRIPTYTEWYNVDVSGGWTDWNGPWNSLLKLHAAGFLHYSDGSLISRGLGGVYWSSTQFNDSLGWRLVFIYSSCAMSGYDKAHGYTLRCLRDF